MTPLLLIPGLACDAALWRDQAPALAALGPVVVPTAHLQADSLPAMAAALLAAHEGPLQIAGASMGAMVALEAWRLAPGRIQGLALLGTTARPDSAEMKALRTEAIGEFEAGRGEPLLRANALFAFHPAHGGRLLADYLAMLARAGTERLVRENRAVMARADLRPLLPTVRCPTLVVGGEHDALTPPECSREIAAGIPGARMQLLPTCGHMLSWEQPALLAALLGDWRRTLG